MIEVIVYFGLALIVGSAAGWFSHRYQVLFVAIATTGFGGLGLAIKFFAPFAKLSGVGFWEGIGIFFSRLPQSAQNAVFATLFIAVIARIATWYHARYLHVETVETRSEMRQRLFREFDYSDSLTQAYDGTPSRQGAQSTSKGESGGSLRQTAGLR